MIRVQCKKIFGITCLGKKLVFHTEIREFSEQRILNIGLFHRVKELSKVNQTGYGVYHGCLESKAEGIFAIACVGKKLGLRTEICDFFE